MFTWYQLWIFESGSWEILLERTLTLREASRLAAQMRGDTSSFIIVLPRGQNPADGITAAQLSADAA
jgi:hypothetical protein